MPPIAMLGCIYAWAKASLQVRLASAVLNLCKLCRHGVLGHSGCHSIKLSCAQRLPAAGNSRGGDNDVRAHKW